MLYKTIHTGSYDFGIQPVSLVDIHSRGVDKSWMQKRAAALGTEASQIQAEPGRSVLHIIAMGSTQDYGPNRNADGFTRGTLRSRHNTFVKNGHVYKHHKNKDPQKASGEVKSSAFNEPMKRVELLIGVDEDKWATELEKVANGEDVPFSMACRVPFDSCSICGNRAPTREDYCGHMKKMAGQILSDGRQVYVDNPNPTFFDISGVFRPADRIAYHLQKVASQAVMTGADLAELDGLIPADSSAPPARRSQNTWRKRAMLRKLAAIEKEIEAIAPGNSGWASDLKGSFSPELKGVSDGELDSLSEATRDRIDKLMGALGQVQISLPLRDFVRIVMGNETGGISLSDIEKHLPGVFSRILDEEDDDAICDGAYDPMGGLADLPSGVKGLIDKMVPGMSLAEGPVQKRTITVIARKIPKPTLTPGSGIHTIKVGADDTGTELLAREYAKYKLSFLADAMEKQSSELLVRLGVLQNYLV